MEFFTVFYLMGNYSFTGISWKWYQFQWHWAGISIGVSQIGNGWTFQISVFQGENVIIYGSLNWRIAVLHISGKGGITPGIWGAIEPPDQSRIRYSL